MGVGGLGLGFISGCYGLCDGVYSFQSERSGMLTSCITLMSMLMQPADLIIFFHGLTSTLSVLAGG